MDRTDSITGLSCNQYPTGIAPRSSITGRVAKANTTASSGQPEALKALATFTPKPEALIESAAATAAAFASPDNAYNPIDTDAHNKTHKRIFTGFPSEPDKDSSFLIASTKSSDEAFATVNWGKLRREMLRNWSKVLDFVNTCLFGGEWKWILLDCNGESLEQDFGKVIVERIGDGIRKEAIDEEW